MSAEEAPPTLRPMLLVLGAMFAFSLMAIFTREANADIIGMSAWRAIFVAIVFAVATVAAEGGVDALRPDPITLKLGAWLGLALAVASSTFVGGYALTTVANTIFLHNLAPVVVFPMAWWLMQEKPRVSAMTGAGIALFGVALLSGVSLFQVSHFASSRFLMGDFLALVSALGYGGVLVLTRMTRNENTPILGTLFVAWSIAAVLLCGVALGFGSLDLSMTSLLWVFGLAVVCTNIPFFLLNLGMRSVPAGTASVLSLSEVLFATIVGALMYSERLAPIGWAGGLLAAIGVLYATTQNDETSSTEATVEPPPPELQGARMWRAGLGLILLNAGVVATMAFQLHSGPVITLVGLALLARWGPGVALGLTDGRFPTGLRWLGLVIGAITAIATVGQVGGLGSDASLLVGVVVLGILAIDRQLAASEPESLRDECTMPRFALLLLGLAQVFGWFMHPADGWLTEAANLAVGLSGLGAVLAAVRGLNLSPRLPHAPLFPIALRFSTGRPLAGMLGTLWLLGGIHLIPTGHVGIVERFGAPEENTLDAGPSWRIPAPVERVTMVDVGRQRRLPLTGDAGLTLLTGDRSMVSLNAVLHYRVSDARTFAYDIASPEKILTSLGRAALVRVVATGSLDGVLTTGRSETEAAVLSVVADRAVSDGLGVVPTSVRITRASVPAPVQAAFMDVISADEEREATVNRAEAYVADLLPRTRGEALGRITRAQGAVYGIHAQAAADFDWLRAVTEGGSKTPELTRERLGLERLEKRLAEGTVVLAPKDVRIWMGEEGHWPKDLPTSDGGKP